MLCTQFHKDPSNMFLGLIVNVNVYFSKAQQTAKWLDVDCPIILLDYLRKHIYLYL